MSDADEDLRTRRGQFLPVEKTDGQYVETDVNGNVFKYDIFDAEDALLRIERLAFHTRVDTASGRTCQVITGATTELLRAIGTEGEYQIFDVEISAETPAGTGTIKMTYAKDGHHLDSTMRIGIANEALSELTATKRAPGEICVSGIKATLCKKVGPSARAILLPFWKEHTIVPAGPHDGQEVAAEWSFRFSSLTLSPRGYNWPLGQWSDDEDVTRVSVTDEVGIHYTRAEHPLKATMERMASEIASTGRRVHYALIGVLVLLILLVWRMH